MATDCQAPVHVTEDKQIQTQLAVVNCPEELEENNLRDLSVILRSNVFPGSSYESEEWCSVVKSVYQDHEVSPDREVGIFMRPKKDYRRKVHQYSRWMEKDIETKNLARQWNAHLAESKKN